MVRLHFVGMTCFLAILQTAIVADTAEPVEPAGGPFGYTLLRAADDELIDVDFFFLNDDCAVCHQRQLEEVEGSMHSSAHTDPLYRRLAQTAREEAGEKVYTYCSGCHSPAGVVSGLIQSRPEASLPAEAKAGITCDVCHQVSELNGAGGPWKEPGNASFLLQAGRVKYGHSGVVAENRSHTGEKREFFSKSEFCASCHTVIHPTSGLRVEHTFGEWKSSVYAEKGIECQDCHMRSVEDAVTVAKTMQPVIVKGPSANEGDEREIFLHYFVGGNANAGRLANGSKHARMAEARLKSAAKIELNVPQEVEAGKELSCDVLVHNVAAGHNIPTGVTELREMWVEVTVKNSTGKVVFRQGHLDEQGGIPEGTIRFGAVAGNKQGKPTFKLWEMERLLWKRTIPPASYVKDTVTVQTASRAGDVLSIEVRLLYRSASPQAVRSIMQDEAFAPKIVEMCFARAEVPVR